MYRESYGTIIGVHAVRKKETTGDGPLIFAVSRPGYRHTGDDVSLLRTIRNNVRV